MVPVANGLQIIPDEDPEHPGHRYGLTYLDWFAPIFDFLENLLELLATNTGLTCPTSDNPVDYATGIEVLNEVDLAIECARGGIVLRRTYRSLSTNDGPFGIGSNHNYGYRLDTVTYKIIIIKFPKLFVITFDKNWMKFPGSHPNKKELCQIII